MELERAIEVETIHNDHNPNITDAERGKAHQISIGAMKREQYHRSCYPDKSPNLLPGETKD